MTFDHLLHLKYEWHVKRKTGEILRSNDRGANSVTNLLNWICFNIGPTIIDIIIAVVYFGVAFNWKFAVLGEFLFLKTFSLMRILLIWTEVNVSQNSANIFKHSLIHLL